MTTAVVVAGHLCLDIIPDLSHITYDTLRALFTPGRLIAVGPVTFSTGGPVSNVGLALHRLGVPVRLMGKVGDDLFGRAIRESIARYDPALAEGMIVAPDVASSYTIVINPAGSDRVFLHCPGANDTFGADDIRYEVLETAPLFHFGYPPIMRRMYEDNGEQLTSIFRRAKATGVTTSLDMALPDPHSAAGRADWERICRATLPYVDIFLPSIEEILFMLYRPTYEALRQQADDGHILPLITPELLGDVAAGLIEMGARVVGLKLGDRGFYLRTSTATALADMGRGRPARPEAWADRELWAPCFRARFVGATGSGDATIAGFLAGLWRGLSAEEAVTAAVAVGACNVEAADTLSGLRSWEETMARVAAGWERHPLVLTAPGWEWLPDRGLWRRCLADGR